MASIKLYFDQRSKRSKRNDNKFPLKLGVSRGKDYALVSLNVALEPNQWDKSANKVINHPNRVFLNTYISKKVTDAEMELLNLELSNQLDKLNISEIKKRIKCPSESIQENKEVTLLFADQFLKFASTRNKKRTREIYENTFSRLKEYTDVSVLKFEDITKSWLTNFDNFLAKTSPSPNARAIHMRNIRAVFNDALDDELISCYPFRKFKIKKEQTPKRSLSVDELIMIRDYPCEVHQEKYRDVFMLIFYLIGINIVDLCGLKSIENGRVEYKREKTSRLYSIKVEPEALAIIERYKGTDYLLNILEHYKIHRDYAKRLNLNIQEIGKVQWGMKNIKGKIRKIKVRTPLFPKLTTYWARHTWATIAAQLDIPKETIAAALGHGGNTITDIYINFDNKKVDEANRKVLDYIKNYGK